MLNNNLLFKNVFNQIIDISSTQHRSSKGFQRLELLLYLKNVSKGILIDIAHHHSTITLKLVFGAGYLVTKVIQTKFIALHC